MITFISDQRVVSILSFSVLEINQNYFLERKKKFLEGNIGMDANNIGVA